MTVLFKYLLLVFSINYKVINIESVLQQELDRISCLSNNKNSSVNSYLILTSKNGIISCFPFVNNKLPADQQTNMCSNKNANCFTRDVAASSVIRGEVLLFRFAAGSNILPSDLFMNGNTGLTHENQFAGSWFKSPLLSIWPSFGQNFTIEIALYKNQSKVCYLKFDGTGFPTYGVDLQNSFFTRDRLIDAYPWNVTVVKSLLFEAFAILHSRYGRRTFYTNSKFYACNKDEMLIATFEKHDGCDYANPSSGSYFKDWPTLFWAYDTNTGGYSHAFQTADELRITGMYANQDVSLYYDRLVT